MIDLPLVKMQEIASTKYDLNNFPTAFVYDFLYNSLSFGISNLTLNDVVSVLTDQPSTLEERKILAIKNYYKAFQFVLKMVKEKKEMDENSLKDLHEIIMDEVNVGGLYRQVDIFVEGSRYAPPAHIKVYERMKKYFQTLSDYPTNTFEEIMNKAAYSMLQLDKIHPFLDGNGKLARLVLNYYLLMHNLAPVVFLNKDKEKLFEYIEEYKVNKNSAPFIEYLINLEKISLDR